MAGKRIARLNEQVRRELTFLLQRDVRDPRIGIVTVTEVQVSPDLYHAKVFYSVMGSDEDRDSAAEGLRAAAGFLRSEIGKRMHIRRAPELHFTYDNTLQHAMHIERLLQEARAADAGAESNGSADADGSTATDGTAETDATDATDESDAAESGATSETDGTVEADGSRDVRDEGHGGD